MLWRKIKDLGCSLPVKILAISLSSVFALSLAIFLVTDTELLITLTLETCATVSSDVDAIF